MSYFVVVSYREDVPRTIEALNARGVGGRFVMQFNDIMDRVIKPVVYTIHTPPRS